MWPADPLGGRKISLESADKRTVATDALATLGSIIDEKAGRDAIHLAVEPSVAAHPLKPGDHVGFVEGGVGICENPVGIVDPFLQGPVMKGQRFWLVVYPRTITSLRHVWTHPAFDQEAERASRSKSLSEAWLRDFCSVSDCPGYEYVMEVVTSNADSSGNDEYGWWKDSECIGFRGVDAHSSIPPEFWDHVEIVTGKKIPWDRRAKYFTCSC
jgi:hypothetical protein